MSVDHGRFVDAVTWWATGDWFRRPGVDAEFVIEDRATNAFRGEGVPVVLDDGGETTGVIRVEVCWETDGLGENSLVLGGVPEDAVVAADGEVER